MALCCIGGVCVPYSAIVPLVIIGLKWLLDKLVSMGILPSAWVERLNAALNGRLHTNPRARAEMLNEKGERTETKDIPSTCCSSNSSDCGENNNNLVRSVETEEEWEALVNRTTPIVVKFTAVWCLPCKSIHPIFCQLASDASQTTNSRVTAASFVTVDVDDLDSVAARYGIAILPAFAVFRSGQLANKYTGSDASRLEEFIKAELTNT